MGDCTIKDSDVILRYARLASHTSIFNRKT